MALAGGYVVLALLAYLGTGFWEIRTDLLDKAHSARLLLCVYREHLVALRMCRR